MNTLPEELQKAIITLNNESIGDMIYDIREREGKGWDGPRVNAWAEMVTTIQAYAVLIREKRDRSPSFSQMALFKKGETHDHEKGKR